MKFVTKGSPGLVVEKPQKQHDDNDDDNDDNDVVNDTDVSYDDNDDNRNSDGKTLTIGMTLRSNTSHLPFIALFWVDFNFFFSLVSPININVDTSHFRCEIN